MAIQVKFLPPAAPVISEDPTTGQVIFRVQFSCVEATFDDTELRAACAAFTHDFKLTRNHEPLFICLIPSKFEGDLAVRIVNIFHGSYIQRQKELSSLPVTTKIQYY